METAELKKTTSWLFVLGLAAGGCMDEGADSGELESSTSSQFVEGPGGVGQPCPAFTYKATTLNAEKTTDSITSTSSFCPNWVGLEVTYQLPASMLYYKSWGYVIFDYSGLSNGAGKCAASTVELETYRPNFLLGGPAWLIKQQISATPNWNATTGECWWHNFNGNGHAASPTTFKERVRMRGIRWDGKVQVGTAAARIQALSIP